MRRIRQSFFGSVRIMHKANGIFIVDFDFDLGPGLQLQSFCNESSRIVRSCFQDPRLLVVLGAFLYKSFQAVSSLVF